LEAGCGPNKQPPRSKPALAEGDWIGALLGSPEMVAGLVGEWTRSADIRPLPKV